MNFLKLGHLIIALNDLFQNKAPLLDKSGIVRVYKKLLQEGLDQLQALPEALTALSPLTEQLEEQDEIHDECIDTLWYVTEAILRSGRSPAGLRAAAQKIRDELGLSLSDKGASYPQQVITAKEREARLVALEPELKQCPLPGGGETLYEVGQAYLAAARAIDALLSARASEKAISAVDRQQAKLLRPALIGLIGRCRASLKDEIKGYPEVPRDLDSQLFGYFDELSRIQQQAREGAKKTEARAVAEARLQAAREAHFAAARAQAEAELSAKEAEAAQRRAEAARKEASDKAAQLTEE